jgi:hypothetical protein
METVEQRVQRVSREESAIVPYDLRWPGLFRRGRDHLRACRPGDLPGRIEHFGSTAVVPVPHEALALCFGATRRYDDPSYQEAFRQCEARKSR